LITSLTGSAPEDKIKNIGIVGSESLIDYSRISENAYLESISTNDLPSGNV
jgi:hypothetical protein